MYHESDESIEVEEMEVSKYPLRKHMSGVGATFIDDFIRDVESQQIYGAMGVEPDKTFLFYGKPGTSKTRTIRALNNEMNKEALEELEHKKERYELAKKEGKKANEPQLVHSMFTMPYDIGRYGTAYINIGSKRVQEFFDQCFTIATYGGLVLAQFDEADALVTDRGSDSGHKEDKKILETIMKNLQVAHDLPNMYVVMMTNLKEACDGAVLRAGRIDKQIEFKPPVGQELYAFIHSCIEERNDLAGYSVVRNYNIDDLVDFATGLTQAEIDASVKNAVKTRAFEVARDRTKKVIPAAYVTGDRIIKEMQKYKKAERRIGF